MDEFTQNVTDLHKSLFLKVKKKIMKEYDFLLIHMPIPIPIHIVYGT